MKRTRGGEKQMINISLHVHCQNDSKILNIPFRVYLKLARKFGPLDFEFHFPSKSMVAAGDATFLKPRPETRNKSTHKKFLGGPQSYSLFFFVFFNFSHSIGYGCVRERDELNPKARMELGKGLVANRPVGPKLIR